MSKQAEAAAITLYKDGLCDWPVSAARVIETAYAEREKAVAELVAAARDRQRCTFGAAGCVECNTRLNEAIGGVEAT